MATALINARIFDGQHWYTDRAVIFTGDTIERVAPLSEINLQDYEQVDLQGLRLVPGLIDTQVNGGGGALLNDAPSVETICTIGDAHRKLGTTSFLPTLISDDLTTVSETLRAVEQAIKAKAPGVLGVHLEGPFLNEVRKGVHNADKFKTLDEEALALLTSLPEGVTYVTLAPECTTPEMIQRLADAGVIVAAGHTAANYEQIKVALQHGLRAFTHLFNAMTPMSSREPGVVGAALEDAESWCGLIVDNYHVHPATLKAAIAAKPKGKMVLVSDAMPTVGAAEKSFVLNGERIEAVDGRCATASGTLAGSDLDMLSAVKNTHQLVGLPLDEALRMASLYPASMLRLDHKLGRLAPGYQADMIAIDDNFTLHYSWIAGAAKRY
ncbi:N-acetylglucosamine-6-phosphate deacetylase [Simiduia sp. 21SJ11W-1]|uniref:N-acetylglucosamine-6-phosphate deacetylase n=1 Tax=Simiduia sp. 21SJ11W-1 TaxID=2909669 RepID=UPI00209D71E5|nr:N-acetylglucosamine-6-phosphate deacetylase [Simiduia sp. 21SJ11W-1]UTA49202.1 N-acetylglucosamine-6-phosphate deacetylase [Simiduia sp. 21SJ11W-1]